MTLTDLLFIGFAFFCGSLPFAVWVGRLGTRRDIRTYGDGNPGAFNVMRAGGLQWGVLAVMLEISKAAFPVGLAHYVFQVEGVALVLVGIAPSLGHAFSPFLGFKGGKAIATVAGAWVGLALWLVILPGAALLVLWYRLLTSSGWAVIFTMCCLLVYLLLISAPVTWLAVWALQTALFVYKHRAELVHRPAFKPDLVKTS